MNPLPRLLGYARPYRGRLAAALAAMLLYAAATAGVATLIKPIIDEVLPDQHRAAVVPCHGWRLERAVLVIYLAKGLGAYFSAYLMTDVGQRVVRDIRDQLFRHILDQSAAFFSRRTTGQLMSRITNDVNQVQQAVSETVGDLMREGLAAGRLRRADVLRRLRGWRWSCVTGAPLVVYPLVRLGQRVRRTTPPRPGGARAPLARHRRSLHRPPHRQGVRRRGARERERFSDASERLYRTNLKITSTVAILPPLMEFLGGLGVVGADLVRQQRRSRSGRDDAGRLPRRSSSRRS